MRSLREAIAGAPTSVLAVGLAAIVIGAGLSGFAIAELTSGDDGGSPGTPAQAPAVVGGSTQGSAPAAERGVPSWPRGLSAHTVVIARSPDRPAAVATAKEARRAGLDTGVMEAARYGLVRRGPGAKARWLVYTGTFATRAGAQRLAKDLAVRYPGAAVELVQSSQ
jgi:hypothetical protein